MKEILLEIVSKIFEQIPFSKKEEVLKKKISDQLIEKYETSLEPGKEIEKATTLIGDCKDLDSLCRTVGFEEEPIQPYLDDADVLEKKQTQTIIGRLRRYSYRESLWFTLVIAQILMIIVQLSSLSIIYKGITGIIFTLLMIDTQRRKRKYLVSCDYENLRFDSKARQYIYDLNDKYSKKLLNTSMLAVGAAAYVVFNLLNAIIYLKYSYVEISQQIVYISLMIQVMVYILVKNYLCKQFTDALFDDERVLRYKKQYRKVLITGGIYFTAITALLLLVTNLVSNSNNWFLIFEVIYLISCGAYNLFWRKRIVFRNITRNVKKIVCISVIVTMITTYRFMSMDLYLTQPYINMVSRVLKQEDQIAYNDDNGVYTITTDKEDFKILQLTDIHLGGSMMSVAKDVEALQACYKLIKKTQPDFVVVTGDLVFPMGVMSFSFNNNAPIMQFANFMRNTGIPWAFTYGNHDTESMATLNEEDFNSLMMSLSFKSSANLLYPYVQPDIYGRSNQMIEIRNTDGSLKQALFLIDSNDYLKDSGKLNEYDYIHDDQVEWYKKKVQELSKQEGYTIPSMIFTHIPLREYKEANDLYESGSDQVTYYYGIIGEKMIDKICCSKYESKLFDTAVELGSTKAIFCGHDHYNNQSLEYKGIRLTYGYSIDYLVMPGIEKHTEQRGGTLITVHEDGGFTIDPYRLKDIK